MRYREGEDVNDLLGIIPKLFANGTWMDLIILEMGVVQKVGTQNTGMT